VEPGSKSVGARTAKSRPSDELGVASVGSHRDGAVADRPALESVDETLASENCSSGQVVMQDARETIRILLADDHSIVRGALRKLLDGEPGFHVVGEASDGAEAVRLARQLKPDILLLDLAMPQYSGLQALRDLAAPGRPVRVVVLAAAIDKPQILELLQLGAQALVLKDSATEDLIQSIRSVMAGRYWIGNESIAGLVEAIRDLQSPARETKPRKEEFGLTPRELQIVEMITAAHQNRDIAKRLSISEDTVKSHVTHIFNKLGVSNRLELALFAIQHRLVSDTQAR
jgi:two-component system nitrate/nitrite response regulator NarL